MCPLWDAIVRLLFPLTHQHLRIVSLSLFESFPEVFQIPFCPFCPVQCGCHSFRVTVKVRERTFESGYVLLFTLCCCCFCLIGLFCQTFAYADESTCAGWKALDNDGYRFCVRSRWTALTQFCTWDRNAHWCEIDVLYADKNGKSVADGEF